MKHRLLSGDEECDLGMRVAAGKDAAARIAQGQDSPALRELVADETLVTHNRGLVEKLAGRYGSRDAALDYDDLVQEGMLGLLTAIDKFEWQRGHKFSTYATWWVRAAMRRSVESSGAIRRPVGFRAPANARSRQSYVEAYERAAVVLELDAPVRADGESLTLGEMIPGSDHTELMALDRVLVEQVLAGVASPGYRRALRLFMAGMNMGEAGKVMGYSRGYFGLALKAAQQAVAVGDG